MDIFQFLLVYLARAESWPFISALNGHFTQPPGRLIKKPTFIILFQHVIQHSPEVLLFDWDSLTTKMTFLFEEMQVAKEDIALYGVLASDMEELEARYDVRLKSW